MSSPCLYGVAPRRGSAMRAVSLLVLTGLASDVYALPSGSDRVVLSESILADLRADVSALLPRGEAPATLSKGAAAGIVVGVIVAGSIVLAIVWFFLRRKKASPEAEANVEPNNHAQRQIPRHTFENDTDSEKFSTTSLTDGTAPLPAKPSPISRIISKVAHPARASSTPKTQPLDKAVPIEAPDNEIFELPASRPPVELDGDTGGSDDFWIIDHEVGLGLDEAYPMTPYEQTKLKMDRQLAGPVPAYTPGDWVPESSEKKGQEDTKDAHDGKQYELDSHQTVSDMKRSASRTCVDPSPLSPHNMWSPHTAAMPSPMSMATAMTPRFPAPAITRGNSSGTYRERSLELNLATRSNSVPTSSASSDRSSTQVQRTPINEGESVCLGPIPENITLPGSSPRRELTTADGFTLVLPTFQPSDDPQEDTLGSNFTIEEEARIAEVLEEVRTTTHPSQAPKLQSKWSSANRGHPLQMSQRSAPLSSTEYESGLEPVSTLMTGSSPQDSRINPAVDMIHVPQIPTQRYSWEGATTPH